MRGRSAPQGKLFFTIDVGSRIRADHPLRLLKRTMEDILKGLEEEFANNRPRLDQDRGRTDTQPACRTLRQQMEIAAAAYNIVRMRKLMPN